ncbi:uncharacterized protein [Primulina huaijiensis]|uniref:uncharacterized protein n=1 Tax=Primulina huaijiensis TaxID=1492673 RepID=UPI003CC794B4
MQALFEQSDIEEIMKIPVPTAASEDIHLWHFSRDGCYTVKSGYRLLMTNIAISNSAQHAPGLWNRMWTVHVPPKACWEAVNLVYLVNDKATNSDSFMQWFFGCLECWPHKLLPTMFMTIWSIWKYRNDKLWNAAERSTRVNIKLAVDFLNDWIAARKSPHITHSQMNASEEELTWKNPPSGFMKCNVDAGSIEVREAKAMSLLDAITWAASLDMQHIIFETDSKTVVEAVHSNAVDHSDFGTIIGECCSLLSRERYYKVHFTRQQANIVAHNLARAAISHASPCVLFDAPSFICDTLIHDCNELALS